MKSFKFIALLMIGAFLFACNSEESDDTAQIFDCSNTTTGMIHNKGLNMILGSFLEKPEWEYMEIYDSLRFFLLDQTVLINEIGGYSLTEADISDMMVMMDEILPQIVESDKSFLNSYLENNNVEDGLIQQFNQVRDILNDEKHKSLDDVLEALELFESVTTSQDKMSLPLKESLKVAKASSCYWVNNYDKWQELNYIGEDYGTVTIETREGWGSFWNTVNSMVEADFWGGAVATAVTLNPAVGVAAKCYGSAAAGIKDLVTGACCP